VAIIPAVETCRRLKFPSRDYLAQSGLELWKRLSVIVRLSYSDFSFVVHPFNYVLPEVSLALSERIEIFNQTMLGEARQRIPN